MGNRSSPITLTLVMALFLCVALVLPGPAVATDFGQAPEIAQFANNSNQIDGKQNTFDIATQKKMAFELKKGGACALLDQTATVTLTAANDNAKTPTLGSPATTATLYIGKMIVSRHDVDVGLTETDHTPATPAVMKTLIQGTKDAGAIAQTTPLRL